MMDKVYV